MIEMFEGWTTCTPGELDRLEHRLKLRYLWALGVKSLAAVALTGAIGVSGWALASALWPSGERPAATAPSGVQAPIQHQIQFIE